MESLAEFLSSTASDTEVVLQATRYALGEITEDLPPEEMLDRLDREATDSQRLQMEIERLKRDPEALEQVCLAFLSDLWEAEDGPTIVRHAASAAKETMPVIEVGILAVVAIYAMWLRSTGGMRKSHVVVKRLPDGTFQYQEDKEFYGPGGPLKALVRLFKGIGAC